MPTGVAMLPRFAAMVCSTSSGTAAARQSIWSRSSSAKGAKVIRATSLVTAMEQKKGSSTRITARALGPVTRDSRWPASHWNAPQDWKPATTAIRHSSRHSTRRSM